MNNHFASNNHFGSQFYDLIRQPYVFLYSTLITTLLSTLANQVNPFALNLHHYYMYNMSEQLSIVSI